MKSLTNYINEKLIVNKNYKPYTYAPKTFDELRKIIEDRYDKLGPGTEQKPIDFNDIDVSNLDSFYSRNRGKGIFEEIKFKYIDISDWDVSNIKSIRSMFFRCEALKSVGDISSWDVSNVKSMNSMFFYCEELKSVGDISEWDVSNVTDMHAMFSRCKSFNQDISGWNVPKVSYIHHIFDNCPIKDEYKPKFK